VEDTGRQLSGRSFLILHPTMIYGAGAQGTVDRILAFIRRFAVVALPKAGRVLVQPIHVDDVVASLAAAALLPDLDPGPIVIAGGQALTYEKLVRMCAKAVGRKVWIVPAPVGLLLAICGLAERFGVKLPMSRTEVLRLTEDRAFAIDHMVARLGVHPVSFEVGLGKMLAAGQQSIR
jgi:nucleoside-diphosphate-sugar epimerase